jgi:hypothetical protein
VKCCVLQKVPYRIPGTTRIAWAVVVAQREGLTLLFFQKHHEKHSHSLVIATENPAERVYEDVKVNRFPLETEDLDALATKLEAMGEMLEKNDFRKLFHLEDESDNPWL